MSIDHRRAPERHAPPEETTALSKSNKAAQILRPNESELKYRRLVEGIAGDYIIYAHNPDGLITYVSPSIELVLGYPAKAVQGLNWRDLIGEHYIGRDLADRVEDEVAAGKTFYKFTVEISHADGSTRLIEIQQSPLFDAAGRYSSMEGIAKDITKATHDAEELHRLKHELEQQVSERTAELIRSNKQLSKSESRYRSVVEHQTEFVVRWTPDAVFTFVNTAFCKLLGRTSEDLIGWCFLPLIYPDDMPIFQQMLARLNYDNPYTDIENRIILPDGTLRWTHWTNIMMFDEGKNLLEFQSVGRDITDLKNAADTIREKEAHLAHISRLATMGELVAGIAHEVHQPLHAAKTFAEAARRNLELGTTENVETAIDCTKEISNAVSRTATIIRRLREFTNARSIEFEHLDLSTIVREASELIAFETRKAKVKLVFDFSLERPEIQGDRIQLEQACVNLLINAFDAFHGQPVAERQVIVKTECFPQTVRATFSDTGCGVEIEDLDRLFQAFYSTKSEGMGMGLSLCKSITEAHGGKIWCEKNEGPGMTFILELPRALRPADDSMTSNSAFGH